MVDIGNKFLEEYLKKFLKQFLKNFFEGIHGEIPEKILEEFLTKIVAVFLKKNPSGDPEKTIHLKIPGDFLQESIKKCLNEIKHYYSRNSWTTS